MKSRLAAACGWGVRYGQRVLNLMGEHPSRVTTALGAIFLASAGGALAVVHMGPDPADLPEQLLATEVPSLVAGLELQDITGWDNFYHLSLHRSTMLKPRESPEALLERLGVADPQAAAWLRKDTDVYQNLLGRTGRHITVEAGAGQRLNRLEARWAAVEEGRFHQLTVTRDVDGQLSTHMHTGELEVQQRLVGGIIHSSLFAATDAMGIPDSVTVQMAEIFQADVDFRRGLHKGDRFSVVYESLMADGQELRSGRVLAAEFHNKGKRFDAIWHQPDENAKGEYWSLDGTGRSSTWLRSPLKFTRISSGFAMRFHPIKKEWRQHKGTDFAAPSGTPVRSVADGVVSFAGVQRGYGNVVYVKHPGNHTTVYAHLSRIGVKKGAKISQGDTIGNVGQTGWATGPHLHFEFREKGKHIDPMKVIGKALAAGDGRRTLPENQRAAFTPRADQMRRALGASSQALQWELDRVAAAAQPD